MRGKGICYDAGFVHAGVSSREPFDPVVVGREMQIIHDDLHCTAVRITGGDPERLERAASLAADAGLEVWFSPFTSDLTEDAMLDLLVDCAERAERVRRRGAQVVLVTGGELSLLNNGFLPGETLVERIKLLAEPERLRERIPAIPARINDFLGRAVVAVREVFGGKVTYAAIPFERVDWTPFDYIGVDLYRSIEVADRYRDGIRALVAQGKPVAITEFGTATYRGAGDRGARAGEIVEWDKATITPTRLDGVYERDESEQVTYLRELLDILDTEGVDSAFVFTFESTQLPHRVAGDPRDDLDRASYGIVKVLDGARGMTYPDMPWEPKAAFAALAERYGAGRRPASTLAGRRAGPGARSGPRSGR
jgi:hypothetical protein